MLETAETKRWHIYVFEKKRGIWNLEKSDSMQMSQENAKVVKEVFSTCIDAWYTYQYGELIKNALEQGE